MSLKGTEFTGESAVYYDHVATGVDGDVALYVEEARSDGSPILELGCGTGRILIPMAAAGLEVVGLDASHDMLMIARNKLEVLPPEVRRRVQLVEGDMRRFAVDRSNVFDPRVQNLAAGTWSMPANRRREFVHPRSGNRVTIKEEFTYDLERQMVGGAFAFDEVNSTTGKIVETIRSPLTLRYVSRYEMEHLLTRAGFRIDTLFGDFKRGPFHAGGEQIWVASRR